MNTSTSANVAAVHAVYEAFGRGDIPAILEHLADDIEWEAGSADGHGVPWLRPGRGKDHVLGFFQTLAGMEFKRFDVKAVAGDGDHVIALIDLDALWLATGGSISDVEAHAWTFGADGLVHSFRHLVDTAQHMKAAGV